MDFPTLLAGEDAYPPRPIETFFARGRYRINIHVSKQTAVSLLSWMEATIVDRDRIGILCENGSFNTPRGRFFVPWTDIRTIERIDSDGG